LCDHFLIFQSIHTHFVAAKQGSHIVLKVFRWIAIRDTPSNHKIWITECCSALVQTESGAAMVNGKAVMMELT
jgi:hypothetical protein